MPKKQKAMAHVSRISNNRKIRNESSIRFGHAWKHREKYLVVSVREEGKWRWKAGRVTALHLDARDGGAAALSSPHHDADESSVRHAY